VFPFNGEMRVVPRDGQISQMRVSTALFRTKNRESL